MSIGTLSNLTPEQRARLKMHVSKRELAQSKYICALRSGLLVKPTSCSVCGSDDYRGIVGHHEDYERPLDVVWLCIGCHNRVHVRYRCPACKSVGGYQVCVYCGIETVVRPESVEWELKRLGRLLQFVEHPDSSIRSARGQ